MTFWAVGVGRHCCSTVRKLFIWFDAQVKFLLGTSFGDHFDFWRNFLTEAECFQGTADEVVDCSHGKQLYELCKNKYEPLWLNGGGHSNLELYPEFIKHLKKFVLNLHKSRGATSGSNKTTVESATESKASESGTADTFELQVDPPEVSRNSLDSRLEKSKKTYKPEKSRMSTDLVDRFRRKKGLVWWYSTKCLIINLLKFGVGALFHIMKVWYIV